MLWEGAFPSGPGPPFPVGASRAPLALPAVGLPGPVNSQGAPAGAPVVYSEAPPGPRWGLVSL
eukprot:5609851-Heterocapsa_arctica.AAC.1